MARVADGTSDVATTGTAASAFVGASAKTISVWCRPASSTTDAAAVYNLGGLVADADGYFGLYRGSISGGSDLFWAYNFQGAEHRVSATIDVGVWTHLALWHDGTNLKIYKNGAEANSTASGATDNLNGLLKVFQGNNASVSFIGDQAEVTVWNAALAAHEIAALAAKVSPLGLRRSALKAHWPLWGLHSPEIDLSGLGHPLTLTTLDASNHAPVAPYSRRYWRAGVEPAAAAGGSGILRQMMAHHGG
jgi:hypothetical protein